MPKKRFSDEYKESLGTVKLGSFPSGSDAIVRDLKLLCADDGPDKAKASVLKTLRTECAKGSKGEATNILRLASYKPSNLEKVLTFFSLVKSAGAKSDNDRAAALKFFRHLYLMKRMGGHSLWVLSLPDVFKAWPSDSIGSKTGAQLNTILDDTTSRFTHQQKTDLTHASQECGAWSNKAAAICAATAGVGATTRDTLIKRWFADENTKDTDITGIANTLKEGYKKIAVAALRKKLVLTDNPIHRGHRYERANAYVWGDALNVVYIEGGFFGPGGDPLTGLTNWTRILVHELSHSQLSTKDHRYRHHAKGLAPKSADFTAAKAITNADSWAFFAADANGKLSARDRKYVLE